MQFSTIILATLAAALASAAPSLESRALVCPVGETATCCQLDVDGVIDTPCEPPTSPPKTKAGFNKSCASTGYTAMCCTAVVDGTGVVCNAP